MAHSASAKKRVRQQAQQRVRNRAYLSAVRTAVKKLRSGVEEHQAGKMEAGELQELFRVAQSRLMKSVSKGRMKKNTASRRIQRLARAIKPQPTSSAVSIK